MPHWDEEHDLKVWAVNDEDEPDEFDCIGYRDPADLAREHAAERYSNSDYPYEQDINVRDRDGTLYEFVVTAEPSAPTFTASKRRADHMTARRPRGARRGAGGER